MDNDRVKGYLSQAKPMNSLKNIMGISLLLGLFCLAGIAGDKQPKESLKRIMHRVQAGVADSNGWYVAESTNGKFNVRLPAQFNDFEVTGVDEHDTNQENHIVGTLLTDKTKYSASLIVQAAAQVRQRFDDFADSFKQAGPLKGSRKIQYHRHEALEVTVGDKKRSAVMRSIIGNKGLFLLIVEFDTDKQTQLIGQIKTFLESLDFPSDESEKL